MAGFPQIYRIVRQGVLTPVVVRDREGLVTLRMELAIVARFGAWATLPMLIALETRLSQVRSAGRERESAADVGDMRHIVGDALSPVTAASIGRIDRAFPEVRSEIEMGSIENESEQFHKEVAEEIGESGVPDAEALSREFQEAGESTETDAPEATGAEPAATEVTEAEEAEEADADVLAAQLGDSAEPEEAGAEAVEAILAEATNDEPKAERAEAAEEPLTDAADLLGDVVDGEAASADEVVDALEALAAVESAVEELPEGTKEATDIASALEEATAELGEMNESTEESFAMDELAGTSEAGWQGPAASGPAGARTDSLRAEIEKIKSEFQSGLERSLGLLERIDQIHLQAKSELAQASAFCQAAEAAHEANHQLAGAESEAMEARATLDSAENRLHQVRHNWEAAQQQAAEAARRAREAQAVA